MLKMFKQKDLFSFIFPIQTSAKFWEIVSRGVYLVLNDYRVSLITAAPVSVVFMQKMTTTGAAVIRLYRVGVTWPILAPTLIFLFCSCALTVHEQTT